MSNFIQEVPGSLEIPSDTVACVCACVRVCVCASVRLWRDEGACGRRGGLTHRRQDK